MSNAKKQHYIPRLILRRFSDDGKKLWTYEKAANKYNHSNIGSVFKMYQAYTTRTFDDMRPREDIRRFLGSIGTDYQNDKEIQKLENSAAPVIDHVINQARHGKPPQLTLEQSCTLKKFVFLMARRTPEARERVAREPRQVLKDVIPELLDKVVPIDDTDPEKRNKLRLLAKHLVSNSDSQFSAGTMDNVQADAEELCRGTEILVAAHRCPRKSFIIGSHGLSIVTKEYANDPSSGSWLPLAHDVVISLTRSPAREYILILTGDNESDRIIDRINYASAKSEVVAARFKEDIEGYI